MKSIWFGLFVVGVVGYATIQPVASLEAGNTGETVLYSFSGTDGEDPEAGLILVGGTLYGTTKAGGSGGNGGCGGYNCGTAFSIDPGTGTETVLYSFCTRKNCKDGSTPRANVLVPVSDVGSKLYGTTEAGGYDVNGGSGTAFVLDLQTGAEKLLYSFCARKNCADGQFPRASLINVKGALCSTTLGGGAYGGGTVFALDPNTGAETVLHSFGNGADGKNPEAGLINVKGELYGTTAEGGSNGGGTIFVIDPDTGAETVLHSFGSGKDGIDPEAGLIDVKGTLYGATASGGTSNGGTVFALNPKSGAETVLYSFCTQKNCADGMGPYLGLIIVKGTLYGTTVFGGAYGGGAAFALDPNTGVETVLWSFGNGADGKYPFGSLINVNGTLYGTTTEGGPENVGTVFALTNP